VTRVNFYTVPGPTINTMNFACQLANQAIQQAKSVLLYCPETVAAEQMATTLWQWQRTSFLPHRVEARGPEKIRLCCDQDPGEDHGWLINLSAETPDWFARFEQVFELVYGESEFIAQKRQRYRFYKDRGYPLAYQDAGPR